jgi:hypothetical protein
MRRTPTDGLVMEPGAVASVIGTTPVDTPQVLVSAKRWLWSRYWQIHEDQAAQQWKTDDIAEFVRALHAYERFCDRLRYPPVPVFDQAALL